MKTLLTVTSMALMFGWFSPPTLAQEGYRIDRFGNRVHTCRPPWVYSPRKNWSYTPRENWSYTPRQNWLYTPKKNWKYTPKTDWTYTPKVYYRDRCWAAYRARTHIPPPRRGPQIIHVRQE